MAIPIDRLTLLDMMLDGEYSGLSDGLVQMPRPERLKIRHKYLMVPKDMNEFCGNICYGQRLFFAETEDNDYGVILRSIEGYYYPIFTNDKWDADKALLMGRQVVKCRAVDVYPVATHLVNLIAEMAERENKLLHRSPSKTELAAGIDKLDVFAQMAALDFLSDVLKISIPEVLLTPYNECLVRFKMAKEQNDYRERYMEQITKEAKKK